MHANYFLTSAVVNKTRRKTLGADAAAKCAKELIMRHSRAGT